MKFKYYIVNEDGSVFGTNDLDRARAASSEEGAVVVDVENALDLGGTEEDDLNVIEAESLTEDEDDEDEDEDEGD